MRRSFRKRVREELIQEFEKYNIKIAAWVQNNEILAPSSEGRAEPFTKYFGLVRDHACRLHGILEHSWSCSCIDPHDANLQLDQRNKIEKSPSFHVCFSLRRSTSSQQGQVMWRGTQIRLSEIEATELCDTPNAAISTSPNGDPHLTLPIALANPTTRPNPGRAARPIRPDPPLTATLGHATHSA